MRFFLSFLMSFFLLTGVSHAQGLADLAKAMGADKVKTLEVSGSGFYFHLGGSGLSNEPWPKFNLKKYHLKINYETGALDQALTLTQFLNPPRGAGFQPIKGEMTRRSAIQGSTGWRYRRGRALPARSTSRTLHTLWTTPHGVIKAAQVSKAPVKTGNVEGKIFRTVSIGKAGAFQATAWFDDKNLLRKVEARVSNAVLDDMSSVTTYSGYKDFGGVKYPTRMTMTYGDHPAFDVNITEVTPNAPADITPPKGLKARPVRVKATRVADGVWYLTGGSHHSVAIEAPDHVIVFEGPLSDGRGAAVINATKKTIPGKPIRYVINSHHHFDHSGGLRAFAAEGVTIVTHASNKPFYEKAYANPTRLRADLLTKSGKKAKFLTVEDKRVISAGNRKIELYSLKGNVHCESNLIAYLPKEKMLIVADAYSSRRIMKGPAKKAHPARAHLWKTITRLKLDIDTILPIHGKKVGVQQLKYAAGVN
jgi:glyoxylase-like metal-dependent hydrolase (beta-lactamase superfamily II)